MLSNFWMHILIMSSIPTEMWTCSTLVLSSRDVMKKLALLDSSFANI